MKTKLFLLLAILVVLVQARLGVAEVTWYFDWYCSGCAKIGARSTGTEGPFSSLGDCESARSGMQSTMDRRGGGVRAEKCYSVGFESPPPSQPSGERAPQGQPGYSRPTYPQPQYEDTRQQEENRRREAERRRQEEEAERARQAEIQRQQENFLRERDDAARRLRGADSAPLGIRGNPTEALEIRGLPERATRTGGSSLFPVWQQLHCIHNIFKGLVAASEVANKDEMEYLRHEMKNAMDSQPLGVSCEQAPPPPKPYGEKELNQAKILSFYQKLLDATVRQGEKLQAANRDIEQAQANVRRAREGLDKPRGPSAKPEEQQPGPERPRERPETKTKDDPIAKAYEQQKAYQEKERGKIVEVYKQQKEKQAEFEDFTINLRAAQRQLNESNSRKIEATNQLNRYGQMSDQVLANPARAGELEQVLTQRSN